MNNDFNNQQFNNDNNNMYNNGFNNQPQQPSFNQPQYEQPQNNFNSNNGFVPNNQPQPSFGGQPSSPYTNNTKKNSKGGMIGIAGVAVVVAILLLYFIPLLTAKSPKGTWTCNYDMFTSMTFTSKSFTFSGNYNGYNTTLSGDYKISSTNVKASKKKSGYKYYLYKVSNVKATAGSVSSNVESGKGFVLGFSKDGKTIHYLSSNDDTAKSFECTKKD